jgi:hypothetical protein
VKNKSLPSRSLPDRKHWNKQHKVGVQDIGRYRRILGAIDGSQYSEAATNKALEFAKHMAASST